MTKIIIASISIALFPISLLARNTDYNKQLKFKPSRDLASIYIVSPKKLRSNSLVFLEGHKFAVKPSNKYAIKSLDFLISLKVPLN
ncbi:MAG: hypothetical protein HAW60_01730 [Bdellovibrionales bacterium]|nr:hypothetical protein [Bdellovibrionales bacterium]